MPGIGIIQAFRQFQVELSPTSCAVQFNLASGRLYFCSNSDYVVPVWFLFGNHLRKGARPVACSGLDQELCLPCGTYAWCSDACGSGQDWRLGRCGARGHGRGRWGSVGRRAAWGHTSLCLHHSPADRKGLQGLVLSKWTLSAWEQGQAPPKDRLSPRKVWVLLLVKVLRCRHLSAYCTSEHFHLNMFTCLLLVQFF